MTPMIRRVLPALLVSLYALAASAQEAYVYISTAAGTYAYDASTTGKLTPIQGSPYQTTGAMVGTNGKYFVTVSSGYVRSYSVKPNGAIGGQVSSIGLSTYSGGNCYSAGAQTPAELDHMGHSIYVTFFNSACDAMQTFNLASNGLLTFGGGSIIGYGSGVSANLPTLLGNGTIGLGTQQSDNACLPFAEFVRESDGTLNFLGGVYNSPETAAPGWFRPLGPITDDPTDHLAIAMAQVEGSTYQCGPTGPTQLASYTVAKSGNSGLVTTNTWQNMPTVASGVNSMKLEPKAGKILAVSTGTGVQFFHFNGASPITGFTGVIGVSGSIVQMGWDNDGHLYALNTSGKMHVYAVTTKTVNETSGSRTVVPIGPFTVRTK